MNVMIVDDEKMGRDSLRALLSMCKFDVHTASNGPEAIEIAEKNQLDVVVIDWMLGQAADGFSVADTLQRMQPAVRVVMISGHTEVQFRAPTNNHYKFLAKPFQLSELLAAFRDIDAATRDAQTTNRTSIV